MLEESLDSTCAPLLHGDRGYCVLYSTSGHNNWPKLSRGSQNTQSHIGWHLYTTPHMYASSVSIIFHLILPLSSRTFPLY